MKKHDLIRFATAVAALLLLVTVAVSISAARSTGEDDVWLLVGEDGLRLTLGETVVVTFDGYGGLAFGSDPGDVVLPPGAEVTVEGRPASAGRGVHAGETVRVVGEGSRWEIRLSEDPTAALEGPGTRIRDTWAKRPSRVDSDEPTRFHVYLDGSGGSLFFYPEGTD